MLFDQFVSDEGVEIESAEGEAVGELAAVHVDPDGNTARFVEIRSAAEEANLIVPVGAGTTIVDNAIVVPYSSEEIEHGPTIGTREVLSVGEASAVLTYYQAGQVQLEGHSLAERSTGLADTLGSVVKKYLPPIVYLTSGEVE